jgi:16S rRNA (adenine1518-N6/adenine1519-N6)-dimethyltransferase
MTRSHQPKPKQSHIPRKRFGQNFLRDDGVISRIAGAVHPQQSDHLVEIGPGQGALTESLIGSGCQLDVIELDRDLVPGLLAAFSIHPRFKLHSADALKFEYASLVAGGEQLRVVGNLPYNISTPLIFKLLANAAIICDMHFMLQLEVVNRLAASPGSKAWGKLGVMAQYHCQVDSLFEVPPSAFSPAPKVTSAIVRFQPRADLPTDPAQEARLRRVVSAAFSQRRKTLRNTLRDLVNVQQLEDLGISPSARAETLDLQQFVQISNLLEDKQ